MEKRCFWKRIADKEESSSARDMKKNPRTRCSRCRGWEEDCDKKIERKKDE